MNLSYKPILDKKERSKSHKKSKDNKANRKVCFGKSVGLAFGVGNGGLGLALI